MSVSPPHSGSQQLAEAGILSRIFRSRIVHIGVVAFSAVALIVGFANDIFGLLPDKQPPPQKTAIEIERESLLLANEWGYQTPIELYFRGSSTTTKQIRWRAVMGIANTSERPMVINDIQTGFPEAVGAELRRIDKAATITVFPSRADFVQVNDLDEKARADARFARSSPLPLILNPDSASSSTTNRHSSSSGPVRR